MRRIGTMMVGPAVSTMLFLTACSGGAATTTPLPGTSSSRTTTPGTPPLTHEPPVTDSPKAPALTGTVLFGLEFGNEGADAMQIMTVHADGTGLTEITSRELGFAGDPSWSSDHQSILFVLRDGPGDAQHLYSTSAAGGTPTRLTDGIVYDRDPSASPDGRRVVLARAVPPDEPTSIYVMNVDGTRVTPITRGTGRDGDWKPSFSPDGTRVVFIRNGALMVANADGSGIRRLVGRRADVEVPRWSPDGRSILYKENGSADSGTRIIPMDGGTPTLVGALGDANWSPDGTLLVGNYWEQGQPYVAIVTMRPDGSDRTEIWHPHPNRDIFPVLPSWAATG